MKKTRGYYRYQHKKHALRHKKITEDVYREPHFFPYFNQFDSFKIHCSCPLCCAKTDRNTKEGNPIPDRRKIDAMDEQEKELKEI